LKEILSGTVVVVKRFDFHSKLKLRIFDMCFLEETIPLDLCFRNGFNGIENTIVMLNSVGFFNFVSGSSCLKMHCTAIGFRCGEGFLLFPSF